MFRLGAFYGLARHPPGRDCETFYQVETRTAGKQASFKANPEGRVVVD